MHVKDTARWAGTIVAGLNRLRALNPDREPVPVSVRVEESAGLGSPPNRGDTRLPRHTRMAESPMSTHSSARILVTSPPMKNRG